MADRVVKVSIVAEVNSYLAGMDKVAKATREGRSEAEALGAKLEAQRARFTAVGGAMLAAGGVIAAGLALATAKAAEFDQAMSAVEAATHAGAAEMKQLRDAALSVSQGTKYSATEAAHAIEELSKAGLSTKAIIGGGLKGALDLAAAGEMDVAKAAGVASTTLGQFGLKGDKAAHVADVLAAGAGKAMGDVSDLSQALAQSGTVAAQFGISLDETVGSLAAFASKGLLGSDAGTSFRSMLLRLANPTGEAARTMKDLGIQAYDAGGKFVGMSGLAGQLQKSLGGLTQEQRNAALSIIFGQDAIRAANVLYSEGAKGISDWTANVNDTGYAAETAAKRLDNFKGDLTELKTAFDNALIGIGESGQGPLRAVTQLLTGLVDGFNKLPEPGKQAVFWVAAVGAAASTAGGLALLAVPKIAAYKAAVAELGPSAQRAGAALGTLAKVGSGVLVGMGIAAAASDLLKQALESIGPSAEKVQNKIATATKGVDLFNTVIEKATGSGNIKVATAQLKYLGDALDGKSHGLVSAQAINGLEKISDEFAKLAETDLSSAQRQFRLLADSAHLTDEQQSKLLDKMPTFKDALTKQATATGQAASNTNLLKLAQGQSSESAKATADAYQEEADKAKSVTDALLNLINTMNAQNDASQKAIQANATWRQGLAALTDQVKQNGTSLAANTEKGSANRAMLAGLAGDAQNAAQAQFEVDQKTMSAKDATDKYTSTLASQRAAFEKAAIAAGFNKDEVKKLADQVFRMPSKKELDILLKDAEAKQQLNELSKPRYTTIFATVKTNSVGPLKSGYVFGGGKAGGGMVPGAPSSVDNVLLPMATGEFVTRAKQAAIPENRRVLEFINSGGVMRGYANGGFVRPQYARHTAYAPQPVSSTAPGRGDVNLNIINPQVRDVIADTREAASMIRTSGLVV